MCNADFVCLKASKPLNERNDCHKTEIHPIQVDMRVEDTIMVLITAGAPTQESVTLISTRKDEL